MVPQSISFGSSSVLAVLATFLNSELKRPRGSRSQWRGEEPKRLSMYAIMGADWGRKKPEKMQLKQREQPYSPLSTPIPIPSPPPGSQITSSPAQVSPSKSPSNPDDYSYESNEQGFPLVQVAPSVEQMHAGQLGEVTLRGGTVTSPIPPPIPPNPHPPNSATVSNMKNGPQNKIMPSVIEKKTINSEDVILRSGYVSSTILGGRRKQYPVRSGESWRMVSMVGYTVKRMDL